MRTRFNSGLALFAVLLPAWPLQGEETLVRCEIELPKEAMSGPLLWGVLRGGLEIGRGQAAFETRSRATESDTVNFELRLPVALPADPPSPVAFFCINRDRLDSYVPSFGDVYQVVPVQVADGRWVARPVGKGWQQRTATSPDRVLTVHYHRFEQDYADASLWTWDERLTRAPKENELLPVGRDEYGLVFQIDTGLYGQAGERIGLLPRLRADWQFKDNGDRFWEASMGGNVYLVEESGQVHKTPPDLRPRIKTAMLDGDRLVTVRFARRVAIDEWPATKFSLAAPDGTAVPIVAIRAVRPREGRCTVYELATEQPMGIVDRAYELRAEGMAPLAVMPGAILQDAGRFFDRDVRLGAVYSPTGTTFRVFAPTATAAHVVVSDAVGGDAGRIEHDLKRLGKGVWEATVDGDLAGKFYAYRLEGLGLDAKSEVTDVYATCTQGRHVRSLIVDLLKTDPPGFRKGGFEWKGAPTDAVIYEMHVRDFTVAANSGVKRKGLYPGLAEQATKLSDVPAIATGLDHLVELGVTHVQLMPVQDFDNVEDRREDYQWGYMPAQFNSPDGGYATRVDGPSRIRELKQAIAALHGRGIGVILDVVYNHTAGADHFEKLVPNYYFRRNALGGYSNGSGCGNEFRSESPMARRFIIDSVKFWATEYGVDGFRFDLMGLIDLETMKLIKAGLQKIRPGIMVYGEPWAGGSTPLDPITDQQHVRGSGIGAFNDHFRDAIKGDRDGGAAGFIQIGDRAEGVMQGLKGAIDDWAADPVDTINYFEAHDNLTCWDKLVQSVPKGSDAMRERMMRLAALILFTSQGTAFVHSGQEFCRSKQGVSNSYNQPDSVNQIDWSLKKTRASVYDYHRGMIAIRNSHPVLRLRTRNEVQSRITFPKPPGQRCLVYQLDGAGLPDENAKRMLVLLNGGSTAADFPLPEGSWAIHADADRAGTVPLGTAHKAVKVAAHSGMLLMQ